MHATPRTSGSARPTAQCAMTDDEAMRMAQRSLCMASSGRESLAQMVGDAQRIRDDREPRVHGSGRGEEARVDDVEVVDLVRLAVHVECGGAAIRAEADGAVLVRHAGERNALPNVQIAREQPLVAAAPVDGAFALLAHELLELLDRPLWPFLFVRLVLRTVAAFAMDREGIFRLGKVFEVSQKSSECAAMASRVNPGAIAGAPPRSVTPSSLPTNDMCPIGYSHSSDPK